MSGALFVIARVIAVAMLFAASGRHPYGYYQLTRLVVCAICVYGAIRSSEQHDEGWTLAYGFVAVLFNPIFPVRLARSTWEVLDVIAALFLVTSLLRHLMRKPR